MSWCGSEGAGAGDADVPFGAFRGESSVYEGGGRGASGWLLGRLVLITHRQYVRRRECATC